MTTKEIIWLLIILATIIILGLILTAEINATEIDWESVKNLIPDKDGCVRIEFAEKSIFHCHEAKEQIVCEDDVWINKAGIKIKVESVQPDKFKWRKSGSRTAYTRKYRCDRYNELDICGKLIRDGNLNCVTIMCGG